jgi:hypothetical protein
MKAHRIQLKLYAEAGTIGDPERFVPVFHAWIRDRVLDELLIDVARYGHVHHGPSVMLVGHLSDYTIELGEGRPGLAVTRKRDAANDDDRLADVFRAAFAAASLLESDSTLSGLRFRSDEMRLTILDRLHAPNDAAGFAGLESEIGSFVRPLLGDGTSIVREGNEREPLSVRIRRPNHEPVAEVAKKLSRGV